MSLPLQNRTILITRSQKQSSQFRKLLEAEGANVLEVPTIEIIPLHGPQLDEAIQNLSDYDWLIFTSANGVEIFLERNRQFDHLKPLADISPKPKICAIGPATAKKLESYGCPVHLIPQVYQAEGVLEDFLRCNKGKVKDLRVLLPRAKEAREILPQTLRQQGASVNVIPIYETVIPEKSRTSLSSIFKSQTPDLITFTSPSTVRHFVSLISKTDELSRFCYAVIGPITAAEARSHNLKIAVQAQQYSIPHLVTAICRYFEKIRGE